MLLIVLKGSMHSAGHSKSLGLEVVKCTGSDQGAEKAEMASGLRFLQAACTSVWQRHVLLPNMGCV